MIRGKKSEGTLRDERDITTNAKHDLSLDPETEKKRNN